VPPKQNTGSGSWSDRTTWTPEGVPFSSTNVLLDTGSPATVTLTGDGNALSVVIGNLNALALVSGNIFASRINITPGGILEAQSGNDFASSVINQGGVVNVDSNAMLRLGYNAAQGGSLRVADNATAEITTSQLRNTGDISLNSTGNTTTLLLSSITSLTTELSVKNDNYSYDGGSLILSDSAKNIVTISDRGGRFTNVNNTISGAGQLGAGNMSIENQAAVGDSLKTGDHSQGVINATGTNNALVIDTGPTRTLTNAGLIQALGKAGLVIGNPDLSLSANTVTNTSTSAQRI